MTTDSSIHRLTKNDDGLYQCKVCGGTWRSVMEASRVPCPGEKK